jgi:hypothetical protein
MEENHGDGRAGIAKCMGWSRSRLFGVNGIAAKTGISLLLRATQNFTLLYFTLSVCG